jgi:uncharacterized membrane protein
MKGRAKASRGFRKELREELKGWLSAGLLRDDQARALEQRYALADLPHEGASLLLMTIYIIGSVLIGGGVITFVAAHWESIPAGFKVALIFAAMLGAHTAGYTLWRVKGTRPTLGHALVVLGTLIFGANIALMAQIFHISSGSWNALAAWAVGAAAISYCLWSVPNAVIAIITSFIWYCSWFQDRPAPVNWYPFVLAAAGLPLAYAKRSGIIFFLVLMGFGVSVHLGVAPRESQAELIAMTLAGAAAALALAGYGAFHTAVRPRREAGHTALVIGAVPAAVWTYVLSFREAAEHAYDEWFAPSVDRKKVFVLLAPVFLAGAVLWAISAGRSLRRASLRPFLIALLFSAAFLILGSFVRLDKTMTVVLANAALVALGVGLTWSGFASLRRIVYWAGVAIVGGTILSRFLEYETSLMLKSIVFLVLGAGVIAGGVKFENFLRRKVAPHD